jgi:hypothetical protein
MYINIYICFLTREFRQHIFIFLRARRRRRSGAATIVEHPAADRDRRRAWTGLPALVREARHLQGLQGLEHPTRHGTHAVPFPTSRADPNGTRLQLTSCSAAFQREALRLASWAPTATQPQDTSPQVHHACGPHPFAHAEYRSVFREHAALDVQ